MPLADPIKRREYHSRYMKEVWYPNNKKRHIAYVKRNKDAVSQFINDYKRKGTCVDCGYKGEQHPYVLDFDHFAQKTTKSYNIGNWARSVLSIEAVKKEMEKCQLVCANCHRIRTFGRKVKIKSR